MPTRTILLIALLAAGCTDYHAQQLIEPPTGLGVIDQTLTGTADDLRKEGRITRGGRAEGYEDVGIDVWVIPPDYLSENMDLDGDPGPGGTVFLLHGLGGAKSQFLSMGEEIAKHGYHVVLMDLRAHGRSSGVYTTWGVKESRDIKAVADDLIRRGWIGEPFYAIGYSLGGAAAILYAAQDDRCRAVMAIAPYRTARDAMRKRLPLLLDSQFDAAVDKASELAGFDPDDADIAAAAKHLTCPLMVVHGKLDTTVPYSQGQAVYAAATPPKELEPISWADHRTILALGDDWFAERLDQIARQGNKKAPSRPGDAPSQP